MTITEIGFFFALFMAIVFGLRLLLDIGLFMKLLAFIGAHGSVETACWVLRHLTGTWNVEKVLRAHGAKIGRNITFRGHLTIDNPGPDLSNLIIEDHVFIGPDVFIDLSGGVWIMADAILAAGVMLITHQDSGTRWMAKVYPKKIVSMMIGSGAVLGVRSTLLCGAGVDARAFVGAGSLVTNKKGVGSYQLWAGVPARFIKDLTHD